LAERGTRQLWCAIAALTVVAVGGLVVTNPGKHEFEDFAGHRLSALLDEELCQRSAMPLLLQLVIQNCSEMVRAQQQTLGQVARDHSRRLNLGVASLYTTQFGGQQLLGQWKLPQYRITTLALAGQFVILQTSSQP
jgi:hypothetical protein